VITIKYIDLTHNIVDKLTQYPNDTETSLEKMSDFDVNGFNTFKLKMSLHTGTHIDTPMHLTKNNKFVSDYNIERFIGNGIILDVRNENPIVFKNIYTQLDLTNKIVLLFTGFSNYFGENKYFRQHPVVSEKLIEFFIEKNIKILGIDFPSPDTMPFDLHKQLFRNEIFIIENLTNLDKLLSYKNFEILAIPLNIEADSSSVRVLAKIIG
jgi:kynurenine formamidase